MSRDPRVTGGSFYCLPGIKLSAQARPLPSSLIAPVPQGRAPLIHALLVFFLSLAVWGLLAVDAAASSARNKILAAKAEGRISSEEILAELRPLSPQKIAELRLALTDQDNFVRRIAIELLKQEGDFPVQALIGRLRDQEQSVREAAEQALIVAGPPSLQPLVEFSMQESCTSQAKVAAAKVLGELGSPEGIQALVDDLVKCRDGGFESIVAFDALSKIGTPAIPYLVDLLRYRALAGGAYLALLRFQPPALAGALKAALDDTGRDVIFRLRVAEQMNFILGTAQVKDTLLAFYTALATDATIPPDCRGSARQWIAELSIVNSSSIHMPLTAEVVEARFGERALLKSYRDEATEAETLKRQKLNAIREANAMREAEAKVKTSAVQRTTGDPNKSADIERVNRWCADWKKQNYEDCLRIYKNSSAGYYDNLGNRNPASISNQLGFDACLAKKCPYLTW